jgi:hypothetical protein
MDAKKARPLVLRFRQKDKLEISVRVIKGETGLKFNEDGNTRPPKIKADISKGYTWKKQGVASGYRVVDINGFDCQNMTASDKKFLRLIEMRPIIVTCRAHGATMDQSSEKQVQAAKAVLLSGVPSKVVKAFEHKQKHKDGCMKLSLTPKPTASLPPVNDTQKLNLRASRGALLDVRGIIKAMVATGEETDERARPSVQGRLEDFMPAPNWKSVTLFNGTTVVGHVKCALKVVPSKNQNWMDKVQGPTEDKVFFKEKNLRKKFKVDMPQQVRVRVYVIRGLNISGAHGGHGNPYLFFKYGADELRLEGYKQMSTSEPRFFRTEERDLSIPHQSALELGLCDFQDRGVDDPEIGRTVIDLEDRWHTDEFQEFMTKNLVPIEYRPLWSAEDQLNKGSIEIWIEILDSTVAAEVKKSQLVQPPPTELEIRVIVWTVRDMSLRLCVDEKTLEERENVDISVRGSIECKGYQGPSALKDQETDIHRHSDGDGEFNWRFVFPRVGVQRGVPLNCFLTLGIWENFTFQRPQMLCETQIDMKTYCTKVARNRELLQIEAEIPLMNRKLTNLLLKEREAADAEYEGGDESSDAGDGDEAVQPKKEIPPAAVVKCVVQVLTQAEAAREKVGQGRNEPNRNPVLTFPKTGRSWQYALPSTAVVIQQTIENFNTGKKRASCLVIFFIFLAFIGLLHFVKDSRTGCPYIQDSCKKQSVCMACGCCYHKDLPDSKFCYYNFIQSAEAACAGKYADQCNLHLGTCSIGNAANCEGIIATTCFATPRGPPRGDRRLANSSSIRGPPLPM